jgi:metallophosphoesterase superfamily enzyme
MRVLDDWLLLPQRFALHLPTATAVLADVHLGYSAARQRLGDAIPFRSVADEMQPLAVAAGGHDIRAVIVAGDLFERGFEDSIWQDWLDVLNRLRIRFVGLVPGNHDRGAGDLTQAFPKGYDLAGWRICHGDEPCASAKTISGHWHPAVRWRRGKRPCFLVRGQHLILPAFSPDAAGADVDADSRWHDWQRLMIVGNRVAEFSRGRRKASSSPSPS